MSPLYFFLKNLTTFFCSSLSLDYRFLLLSLGCHPIQGVTPNLFYLSDLVSPLFFVNLPTKIFSFGVTPLEGVTQGGPPPVPLVMPLGRPTVYVAAEVNGPCLYKMFAMCKSRPPR